MKFDSTENLDSLLSLGGVEMAKSIKKDDHSEQDNQEYRNRAKKSDNLENALTPEKIELIKKRIAENFYDQDDILQEIVGQILNSEEFRKLLAKYRKS